jgi:hypothetical protein
MPEERDPALLPHTNQANRTNPTNWTSAGADPWVQLNEADFTGALNTSKIEIYPLVSTLNELNDRNVASKPNV